MSSASATLRIEIQLVEGIRCCDFRRPWKIGVASDHCAKAALLKALTTAMRSSAWGTVSAALKDKLAVAIAKTERGPAEFYANKIAASAGTQPIDVLPGARAQLSPEMAARADELRARTHPATLAADNAEAPASVSVPAESAGQSAGTDAGGDEQGAEVSESPESGAAGTSGRTAAITVPGEAGKRYNARCEVRELSDIQPSHNGQTFSPDTRYAYRKDRNYANAANQRKVVEWSTPGQFNPAYHLTDNPDAVNGPPIVDSDGNVLGGNGRSMILQRAYADSPKSAAAYRSMLADRAAAFGVDPAQVAGMKQPMLVRALDDAHLAEPAGVQDALTDFDKAGTAALTPAERAIADARRVSPETLMQISQRLEKPGPDATLAQSIEGREGVKLLQRLMGDGVISPQETTYRMPR